MRTFWAFFYGWLLKDLFSRPTSKMGWVRVVLLALAAFAVLDVGRYVVYPDVSKLAKENPKKTSMMKYRESQYAAKGKKFRYTQRWVPFSRISPYMTKAVLIAEDDRFWSHEGFDFEAIGSAIEKDIKKRKFKFGGSTVSQQLAKNLYLKPTRNPIRKLKEAILTWRIEHALKKRRILELYLNVAEWGDGIFGIEAATRHYYGVSASSLGPEQAARLAAVLPNPHRFSPVNPSRYVANRSRIIYRVMLRRGIVIPEFKEAMAPEQPPDAQLEETGAGDPGTGMSNYSGAAEEPAFTGATSAQ